jgi:large subunit ribosomal protein L9
MKIVLLERIEKLGKLGDVVTVKNGYARNYLIPQKKALRATNENISVFENQRAEYEAQSRDLQTKAEGLAKTLENVKLSIVRQASESGILYGSVSSRDIAKEIEAHYGIALTHGQVRMEHPFKISGIHEVTLQLHPEVSLKIIASIAPSLEEAKCLLEKPAGKSEAEKKHHEDLATAEAVVEDALDSTEAAPEKKTKTPKEKKAKKEESAK